MELKPETWESDGVFGAKRKRESALNSDDSSSLSKYENSASRSLFLETKLKIQIQNERKLQKQIEMKQIVNVIHLGGVEMRMSRAEAVVHSPEHGNGAIDLFSQFLSVSLFS